MKAVLVTEPGMYAVVHDLARPEPDPYQALVHIEACSICNSTDRKIIDRHFVSQIPLPLVLGHESVGTVISLGERVRSFELGQRVLRPGASYPPEVGVASAWGGMAEYGLVTDTIAWQEDHPDERPNGQWAAQQIVPPEIPPTEATALITLKETLSASRAAGVGPDTSCAIVGTGPVAQTFAFWARYLGAPLVAVYGRRALWARTFLDLGADAYVAGDEVWTRKALAPPERYDRVIEAVGSSTALQTALTLVAPGGLVGNYGVAPEDDVMPPAVQEGYAAGTIMTLPVREQDVHQEVLQLVQAGTLELSDWISHVMPLERVHEALKLLAQRQATKIVLTI
jgi:L-iditol 2-dehydrogenase